jgi:PadR family transcriptional regulator PadR
VSQDLSSAFGEPATSRLRGLLPPRTGRESAPAEPDQQEDGHATARTAGGGARPAESRARPAGGGARSTEGRARPTDRRARAAEGSSRVAAHGGGDTGDATAERTDQEVAPAPAPAPAPAQHRRATPASGAGSTVSRSPTSSTNRRWGTARVASREHVDLLVLCALREGPASARGIIERLRAESGGALQAPERTVHNTLHRLARNRLLHRVHGGTKGGPHYGLTTIGERAAQSRARQWRLFASAVGDVVGEPDPR